MYIVLGATGNVGSAVAAQLLKSGREVIAVTRRRQNAASLHALGAQVAEVDVNDPEALRSLFRRGERLFLLNPPADPSVNTIEAEARSMRTTVAALEGSGIVKVVAESTYGAQPGSGAGDLNVLFDMEQLLKRLPISVTILRAAYYMSNWDMALESAAASGTVGSFYPLQFSLPMVAPADLGRVAAKLLQLGEEQHGTHYVEGPNRYTPLDVASAFSKALYRSVSAVAIPRDEWIPGMMAAGFSKAAAASMARMTELTLGGVEMPSAPERGLISLDEYIRDLVQRRGTVSKMGEV